MQANSDSSVIWDILAKKQGYAKIPEMIKSNPDLVNSVNPKSGQTVAMHILNSMKKDLTTPEILSALFSDPKKVDLNYTNPRTEITLVNVLIDSIRAPYVIELLKDDSRIIFDGDELAYASACESKTFAEESLKKENASSDKDEESISSLELRIKNLEKVIPMLRDITILHAIKEDDAGLMKRLDKAGGEMSDFLGDLGDKKLPTTLLKRDGNIRKLFNETRAESISQISKSVKTLFQKEEELQKLDKKALDILKQADKDKLKVFQDSTKEVDRHFKKL